jgi:hypothetical protein
MISHADRIRSRREPGKFLRGVGSVKQKRRFLETLRPATKAVILQADAVQRRHLIPRIPGELHLL